MTFSSGTGLREVQRSSPARLTIVSCHQFGRGVVLGVLSSLAWESGQVELADIVTLPEVIGRTHLGPRYSALQEFEELFSQRLVADDPRLGDIHQHLTKTPAPDLVIVAGWPRLIARSVLDDLRGAGALVVGMHPSPLPQGRGQSPIGRTILEGLRESAVTVFELEEGPDTGCILATAPIDICASETASTLYAKAIVGHKVATREFLDTWIRGRLRPLRQNDHQATQWQPLRGSELVVTESMAPDEYIRRVRAAMPPYQGAVHEATSRRALTVVKLARSEDEPARGVPESMPGPQCGSEWRLIELDEQLVMVHLVDEDLFRKVAQRMSEPGGTTLDPALSSAEPTRHIDRRYSGIVLLTPSGKVLLQRRDSRTGIVNPGLITLFGGVSEGGETDLNCAAREIREELELDLDEDALAFMGFVDKLEADATVTRCAIFMVRGVEETAVRLREGARIEIGHIADFLSEPDLSAVCRLALTAALLGAN